jgi:4-hydroxy-3-methylbut-2-enyl diphosphate reductase
MELVKAGILGYCMGVRRAVEIAYRQLAVSRGRVYTMGPLIHNPQVRDALSKRGVEVLKEDCLPEDLTGAVIVIRAHGISPVLETELVSRGACLVDATCPNVKASQLKAQALAGAGYRVFLAGEARHGEVAGIRGYAPGCAVVANPAEAATVAEYLSREIPGARAALIGQTTISLDEYTAIGKAIQAYFPQLEIIDTICSATRDRQDSLRKLCGTVDAVVVAGGKESANTRRLLAIAEHMGKPAWLVENAGEVPSELAVYSKAGLCAGASTPDEIIGLIEEKIRSL